MFDLIFCDYIILTDQLNATWLCYQIAVATKLVDAQGLDCPWTLASLSDEDLTIICNMIQRPGRLVSRKTSDSGNQISVLAAMNLKLVAFMFKTKKHCSKDYKIRPVNSTSVLQYQHQWELEQKKVEKVGAPKVDKSYWTKTMENLELPLKLMRGMRGALLAYVVE